MAIMSGQHVTVGNSSNGFYSFPDNWELRSLGEISTFFQYGISSSSGGNYSVPILKMNNLQDGHIDFRDLDYIRLSKAEMESFMLNKGDLLINRTNSIDLVGKAAMYDLAGEHVFASYLVRFRFIPSVLPAFVNYFLNSEPGQRKLKLLATKGVSQANINPSLLKKQLLVPIPPILEQHHIVEVFHDLDQSMNLTAQLIAKKRDIKQATMQQLLTGKMRLPGFSGEWEMKKLGEILKVRHGKSQRGVAVNDGMYPILATSGEIGRTNDYLYDKPSVLIGRKGTIDSPQYMDTSFWTIDTLFYTEISDYVHPKFVFYLFNMIDWPRYNEASGVPSLNASTIESIEVQCPLFLEQQAIATILSDMDAEIAALEQKRDKLRALKQGMMQELLTGKTRLL